MALGQSTHCGTAGIKGVGGNSLMPADLAVRLCDRRHRQLRTMDNGIGCSKGESGIRAATSRHLDTISRCYATTLHHRRRCK
jgi:hypothetical protein